MYFHGTSWRSITTRSLMPYAHFHYFVAFYTFAHVRLPMQRIYGMGIATKQQTLTRYHIIYSSICAVIAHTSFAFLLGLISLFADFACRKRITFLAHLVYQQARAGRAIGHLGASILAIS